MAIRSLAWMLGMQKWTHLVAERGRRLHNKTPRKTNGSEETCDANRHPDLCANPPFGPTAMSAALIVALCCTGALLLTTGYFVMGSVPLLILKYDVPMDARFVRGFFNTYYLAAMCTAGAAALSYAWAGRLVFAAGAAALAGSAALLRRQVIPQMDRLRTEMEAQGATAIAAFRRIHVTAILLNLAQLALIVWALITAARG